MFWNKGTRPPSHLACDEFLILGLNLKHDHLNQGSRSVWLPAATQPLWKIALLVPTWYILLPSYGVSGAVICVLTVPPWNLNEAKYTPDIDTSRDNKDSEEEQGVTGVRQPKCPCRRSSVEGPRGL